MFWGRSPHRLPLWPLVLSCKSWVEPRTCPWKLEVEESRKSSGFPKHTAVGQQGTPRPHSTWVKFLVRLSPSFWDEAEAMETKTGEAVEVIWDKTNRIFPAVFVWFSSSTHSYLETGIWELWSAHTSGVELVLRNCEAQDYSLSCMILCQESANYNPAV